MRQATSPGDLETIRRWARLLDSQFRVPGTNVRFGLDPIIGLVPGLGDFVGPIFSILVIAHAWKLRVPKVVIARMLFNAGIDATLGLVPFLGDAVDIVWKANQANVRLLEQHSFERRGATRADWLFVGAAIVVALALAALPVLVVIWIGRQLV
ncbi:MAG TPA: DUF4112 domain-containing protein [Vicinamibacterales bacterium]|nr:DUF4112 domain-containing protein [Vicinamibacterales bacterium]